MTPRCATRPRPILRRLATLALAVASLGAGGCMIANAIGAMAQSAHLTGSHAVEAKYRGLDGHGYAVLVSGHRAIEADYPGLVNAILDGVNRDLRENTKAVAYADSLNLIRFMNSRTDWRAMPPTELMELIDCDRLIVIELTEYRLHEPGNREVWEGLASGEVVVFERGSVYGDEPSFTEPITVGFPDSSMVLVDEIPANVVDNELRRRFSQRAAWLFYDHDEPNVITY